MIIKFSSWHFDVYIDEKLILLLVKSFGDVIYI